MKKHLKLLVLCISLATLMLAATVCGAGFSKTQDYPGTFADVDNNAWYAKEVQSAYELGFVNGKSDTSFDPNGTMTVAEGITIASRVHASYNGKTIPEVSGGNWYDMYVKYAIDNGIFEDGYFNNYNRTVRRYEMAVLFASAVPESYLAPKNDITSIPDVNEKEEYADTLLTLYKAGVVLGSDSYGTFLATNPVKRSEAAAIVNRTALPENRLSGTLEPMPEMNEAYYLMDHFSLLYNTRGVSRLATSWNFDNRFSTAINTSGLTTNALSDTTDEGYAAINRNIKPQSEGVMTLTGSFTISSSNKNGARVYFENLDGTNVLEIFTEDDVFKVKTQTGTVASTVPVTTSTDYMVTADLDTKKGYYVVNGVKASEFTLGDFGELSKFFYSTSVKGTLAMTPSEAHMWMNYPVNENFYMDKVPVDWTVSDGAVVESSTSDRYGTHLLKFGQNGTASKKFDEITGKVVFESYFHIPEKDDTLLIKLDDALTVKVNGGNITTDGLTHSFKNSIWQCVHIEADTNTDKAVIFINGKKRATVNLTKDAFDEISFEYIKNSADGFVWLDDIKVYNIYDYADYVPVPVKQESPGYTTIMSVCSLWREGTHSGWDCVAPYDECSPLMGYYDEGIPEVADWETKIMVEHGMDAFQYCWYATSGTEFDVPIKFPGLYWSQHDGYFYSKYSDMIDYCFMWENQNFNNSKMTLEQFESYLWDYWVEWYFRDDRYLTIDNKPVFHIYSCSNFLKTFGEDGAKQVIEFMNEDIKKYGYDGMIVLWQSSGSNVEDLKKYNAAGGDGIMAYGYGQSSHEPAYLVECNEKGLSNIKSIGSDFYFAPTVATGRNIMGWENARTPLSTVEQHREVLEYYKDFVKKQNNSELDIVYFSTWNEYAEGHWLAPSGLNGFGYADEWRRAFTNAPEVHDDIVPTINQKNRICKLYNDERTTIRSWLLEDYEVPTTVIKSWDFENGATVSAWSMTRQIAFEVKDGVLHNESVERDPIIRTPEGLGLDASTIIGIRVTLKSNVSSSSEIFFITDKDSSWNANKCVSTSITASDEFTELYFDTSTCTTWQDNIECIRFDLIAAEGIYDIKKIELLGYGGTKADISVDGLELEYPPKYLTVEGDQFYAVADPDAGIFTSCNFYHEWNRWTGKLFLKTSTDTEFIFTVDSDTVLVDGKEVKLAKPFYLFDHMPVLPLTFILDKSGIEYKATEDLLEIKIRDYDYEEVLSQRIPFEYEFLIADDNEGWEPNGVTSNVSGGHISITASPSSSATTGYDPGIIFKNFKMDAADYSGCEIRLKPEYLPNKDGGNEAHPIAVLYFATTTKTGLNEKQTFKLNMAEAPVDEEGYITLKFDFSKNPEHWNGHIITMRFDPSNNNGTYHIDYIRFIKSEKAPASTTPETPSGTATTEDYLNDGKRLVAEKEAYYSFEFDNAADVENISESRCSVAIQDGHLIMTADAGEKDIIVSPKVMPEELKNTENYDVVVVKMKMDLKNAIHQSNIFFLNDSTVTNSYSAEAGAKTSFDCATQTKEDGYIYVVLDLGKNKHWTGNLTAIRFDPADLETTFYIDYIKAYKLGTGSAAAAAPATPAATDGSAAQAGVIINGDAEGDNASVFTTHNGTVSIVTEENGNKAWMVQAKPGRNWTYAISKFDGFRTGKTYKFSYDIKLVGDSEGGTDIGTSVVLNFRYTDSTAQDGNGSHYDHNVSVTNLKVSDGWVHVEGEFVAANVEQGAKPHEVAFYSNPTAKGSDYTSFSYMFDNLVVTEV